MYLQGARRKRMQLFEAYMPVISFAALFRDTPELNTKSFETVRADVEKLLASAEKSCVDVPEEARKEALFAVCAFVDEALLTSSWQNAAEWSNKTLQRICFCTTNAGVEFFEHLRALLGKNVPDPEIRIENTDKDPLSSSQTSFSDKDESLDGELIELPAPPEKSSSQNVLPVTTVTSFAEHSSVHNRGDSVSVSKQEQHSWREECLALYGACLSMGFTGRYYNQGERETLYQMALASLESAVGKRISPGQHYFTPESYYVRNTMGPRRRMPWRIRVPLLVLPALLTMLLFVIYDRIIVVFISRWLFSMGSVF